MKQNNSRVDRISWYVSLHPSTVFVSASIIKQMHHLAVCRTVGYPGALPHQLLIQVRNPTTESGIKLLAEENRQRIEQESFDI